MKRVEKTVNALLIKVLSSAFVVIFVLLSACTNSVTRVNAKIEGNYIILTYSDFGPDAEPLLGVHHWQWDDVENRKTIKYNIKVVVYNNVSLSAIKNKFPVNKMKRMDYRYVDYLKSREYLDKRIQDMYEYLNMPAAIDTEDDVVFLNTIINLYKTALKIERGLDK